MQNSYILVGDDAEGASFGQNIPGTPKGKGAQSPTSSQLDLSHDDIRSLLQNTIGSSGSGYVRDVYPSHFVHTDGMGNMMDRPYSIGSDMSVTLGPAKRVRPKTGYEAVKMAQFAIGDIDETEGDDDFVVRRGKIFEAGDYPDKKFQVSTEELASAVDAFQPVELDVEHKPSMFDGKLGSLFDVAIGEKPGDLMGAIKIPRWLDKVAGPDGIKVSTTWTREPEKRISKLALAINPRVSDATMMSAYAQFTASRNKPTQTTTRLKKQETKRMNITDRIKKAFGGMTAEELAEFADADDTETEDEPKFIKGTVLSTLTAPADFARVKALEDQVAEMAEAKRKSDAESFVDGLIRDRRLMPAQRAGYVAELSQAMKDDTDSAVVTFSKADGSEAKMSRTELKKANLSQAPQHDLFRDHALRELPKDAALIRGSVEMNTEQEAYDAGVEFGKKWAEDNLPGVSMNGNGAH